MQPSISKLIYCSYDFCALVIGVIVLVNYFMCKRFNGRTALMFRALAISSISSAVVHISAVIAIAVIGCPLWLNYSLTALNYFVYNGVGIIFLFYTLSVVYENRRLPNACYIISSVLIISAIVGVVLTLVNMYANNLAVVVEPTGYEAIIYASQFAALFAAFVYSAVHYKRFALLQRINICFFIVFNIASVLIQTFLRAQICNFALAIAVMLIYVSLQRPESLIDETSGLFNKSTFVRRVTRLTNAKEHFFVFGLEVNNMAIINSTFGITSGNDVIKQIAVRLKGITAKTHCVYRLGGVRFAIVFNNRAEVDKFAAKYEHVFDEPFAINDTKFYLTATACLIAIPEITDNINEVEDIIRHYRSSNKTSGIIEADKEAIEKIRRSELIDYAIQNALTHRLFEVYYQPIYSLKEKRFNSCEALIRLNDPNMGFISPDVFIPIAEQNGRIVDVGRFVIDEVCRFIKECQPEKYGIDYIDVNLSVMQCMHPEIINDVELTLKKYNVPREMLNLEITETAAAQSRELLQSRLDEFHTNGFTISLDDFGTGFSSMDYLINFPFDVVKLDKSLVWAYMDKQKYAPILQHYMPMLHGLGTKIVAEGVETQEMVKELDSLGCDYLQGYYYSRPVPKDAFMHFIRSHYQESQQLDA